MSTDEERASYQPKPREAEAVRQPLVLEHSLNHSCHEEQEEPGDERGDGDLVKDG